MYVAKRPLPYHRWRLIDTRPITEQSWEPFMGSLREALDAMGVWLPWRST